MTRVLFDTNVILDVLLDRRPHAGASSAAWLCVEKGVARGYVAAHAVTTVYYLLQKELGAPRAREVLASILRVFDVASIDAVVLREAMRASTPDFEDAVTAASARRVKCDYILTRDPKGFRGSPVRAVTPEAVVPILKQEE